MSGNVLRSTVESRRPLVLYTAAWTVVLTMVVAVAAVAPEIAFLRSISSSSSVGIGIGFGIGIEIGIWGSSSCSSLCCDSDRFVWVPMDVPSVAVCLPKELFRRSKIDVLVPPVFAAVVVAASVCVVRAFGL